MTECLVPRRLWQLAWHCYSSEMPAKLGSGAVGSARGGDDVPPSVTPRDLAYIICLMQAAPAQGELKTTVQTFSRQSLGLAIAAIEDREHSPRRPNKVAVALRIALA
jgi:hypothetical protein